MGTLIKIPTKNPGSDSVSVGNQAAIKTTLV